MAVFLKGDSGDLQVGPRGRLGGGPGLAQAAFLAVCLLLASRTDYNFPSTAVLRRPPPARHCLIVCRGKLQEEINLLLTPSREFHPQSPLGMPEAWAGGGGGR